jgi:hypothetical protein
MRNLVFRGKTYQYRVGTGSTVIKFPDGTKAVVSNHDLKGVDPNTFERGQYKKTSDGMVLPSEIQNYIERLVMSRVSQ